MKISLPQNNTESVCPPGLKKGMCHTAAVESDKNNKPLSLIMRCVIPNFFSSFLSSNPCLLLGNILFCTLTYGEGYHSAMFSLTTSSSYPFFHPWYKNSTLNVYVLQHRINLAELAVSQLRDNGPSIGLLVLQTQIQGGRRSYYIRLDCPIFQR